VFSKLLIANRGEIACRVIRTARGMGIATIAVYSDADAAALHVAMADEARRIGPPPARDSYLNIAAIVEAATASGADAVHPGYGFLSENPEFAEACTAAGLVFVGPPVSAIRAMGSKAAAKALMAANGVPVVPGYHGDDQDPSRLLAEAEKIGFPVILKASAGGGGRGMRIVSKTEEFTRALDGAKREAKGAFGDERMLVERYLDRPRHIEVQVFGDSHGNLVHLFERDCSIQRRHQKVIEEGPAPGLEPAVRQALGVAAIAAAKAVQYVGAGTVEFIAPAKEPAEFSFMEMNTRLQVEHPVTEAVTGLDLVEWQLRVAAGEKLPLTQKEIILSGHAIEVRLYAENPNRNFLPATGTLHRLRLPQGNGIRVDSGVREGDTVTPFYDPLMAKIIAFGDGRDAARRHLARALSNTAVLGVLTNLGFLHRVAVDAEFAAGAIDTGFIERRRDNVLPPAEPAPDFAVAAAALQGLSAHAGARTSHASPWLQTDGWRPNLPPAPQTLVFRSGGEEIAVDAISEAADWRLRLRGHERRAAAIPGSAGRLAVTLDGEHRTVTVLEHTAAIGVFLGGQSWHFDIVDPLALPAGAHATVGRLTAPMPGRVVQLLVVPGAAVRRGQPLVVVEAMKMEHTIAAPRDGVVEAVRCAVGDLVEEGAELIVLAGPSP
jgi:3-methylcrotonyl-CoA carboxylase alpha subunit